MSNTKRQIMDRKSILITGCSSGIGKCLARGLRDQGYRIFATARQQIDLQELAEAGYESLRLDLDSTESIGNTVNELPPRTDTSFTHSSITLPTDNPARLRIFRARCCGRNSKLARRAKGALFK
jgi:NAD(P)-dependent dehydrogenase (short-subunit alcohol dehydrogenase family)